MLATASLRCGHACGPSLARFRRMLNVITRSAGASAVCCDAHAPKRRMSARAAVRYASLMKSTMISVLLLCVIPHVEAQTRRNIVFILSDDHRHDFMRFHPNAPKFLETPALDRMA